jgi:putative ATP-dependent endonuclease of the OLD family
VHISELRIRNFRNFHKARFKFSKGVNTLIGENGSGKTNALYGLRLLLDDTLARRATLLRETDFCRAVDSWQGEWIVISVDFEELDPCEGCQLLKHRTGHMNGTDSGTYTLFFRPKLLVRKHLHELTKAGSPLTEVRTYLESLTIDDYEAILTGRGEGDILDDSVYVSLAGDFGRGVFPNPDDDDQGALGVRMPTPVHNEISCTFAPALRDVVSDLRGYRSNPLLALLRGAESTIQIEEANSIIEAVGKLNDDISSLKEIEKIASGIQMTLQATVGHTYAPSVSIESALPNHLDKLLQRLSVTVGENVDSDYRGELSEQSLGGANLIYLALKLLEYELKLSTDRVAHFLLIEEPEAHIHTHIQKTLFNNQSARQTQVIVSTHSTHISSAAKIRSVNVLAQKADHAEVYQPASGLGEAAAQRVERYLDAVRSTLLFAKGVVLVEGTAELLLVPSMLQSVFGISPDELGLSVISMDSAFFEHIAVIFHDDRVRRRCSIITDHDQAFIALGESPDNDDKEQKHARAAADVGEQRRATLSSFCGSNPWVSAFFANHTFEVDFLAAGNASEICAVIEDHYSQPSAAKRSGAALKDDDLSVAGREVVRVANKLGKGWFSLLLAEKLTVETRVPDYVLQAIAFAAADSFTDEVLKRIGLFRINSGALCKDVTDRLPDVDVLQAMPASEFLEQFTGIARDDSLTELVRIHRED